DQPERIVERQAVDAGPQPDAPRALGGRGDEDAGRGREPERRGVMLGQVVGVEPRGVVLLQERKPALVEFRDRRFPPVEMIEDAYIHDWSMTALTECRRAPGRSQSPLRTS